MRNKILTVLAVIIGFSGAIALGWFAKERSVQMRYDRAGDVASNYVEKIIAGDVDAAYKTIVPSVQSELDVDSLETSTKPFVSPTAKIVAQTTTQIQDRYVTYFVVEGLSKEALKLSNGYFVVATSVENGKLGVESSVVQ